MLRRTELIYRGSRGSVDFPIRNDKAGACQETSYNGVYTMSTNLLKMMNLSVKLTEFGATSWSSVELYAFQKMKKAVKLTASKFIFNSFSIQESIRRYGEIRKWPIHINCLYAIRDRIFLSIFNGQCVTSSGRYVGELKPS